MGYQQHFQSKYKLKNCIHYLLHDVIYRAGCNRWRDMVLPVDLLETYCKWREIHKPRWNGTTSVIVDNQEYTLEQFGNDE